MNSWTLRIGAAQMTATDDLRRNLATCQVLIAQAAQDGAKVVLLPECFAFLGAREGDKLAVAEDLEAVTPGPIIGCLAEAATKHGVTIIGGGMPERIEGDPKRTYNTAVVVDPAGAVVATYRKIHLFDVDIPGGAVLRESDSTAAGVAITTVVVDDVRIGLSICYDVRFAELYRTQVLEQGAEVLVVPAAFTAHTGKAHWHTLLRARAIENQAWMVAAAQWGQHNEKRATFGHSMVIDPWGEIVAERPEGDGVVVHTLDGAVLAKRRAQMPCLQHAAIF